MAWDRFIFVKKKGNFDTMDQRQQEVFKEKLDSQHSWPGSYVFKFIVPKGKETDVIQLFNNGEAQQKASSKGNYISITAKVTMQNSDEVMAVYLKAHTIEGIIAL